MQYKLPEVFADLNQCYSNIESRIRAEAFKQRVMNCFRAWEDWALYPQDFLIKLQNIFLGFVSSLKDDLGENDEIKDNTEDDDDEDVDGVPLDGAALLKTAQKSTTSVSVSSLRKRPKEGTCPISNLQNKQIKMKNANEQLLFFNKCKQT